MDMLELIMQGVEVNKFPEIDSIRRVNDNLKYFLSTGTEHLLPLSLTELLGMISTGESSIGEVYYLENEYTNKNGIMEEVLKTSPNEKVLFTISTVGGLDKVVSLSELKHMDLSETKIPGINITVTKKVSKLRKLPLDLIDGFKDKNPDLSHLNDFLNKISSDEEFVYVSMEEVGGVKSVYEIASLSKRNILSNLLSFVDTDRKTYVYPKSEILHAGPVSLSEFKKSTYEDKVLAINYGLKHNEIEGYVEFESPLCSGYDLLFKKLKSFSKFNRDSEVLIFDIIEVKEGFNLVSFEREYSTKVLNMILNLMTELKAELEKLYIR